MSVPSKHVLTIIRRIYFIFTRVRIVSETNSNYEITLIYFFAQYFDFTSKYFIILFQVFTKMMLPEEQTGK